MKKVMKGATSWDIVSMPYRLAGEKFGENFCYWWLGGFGFEVRTTWSCNYWGWGSAWWDTYCWFVCSWCLVATGWNIIWYTYVGVVDWHWRPVSHICAMFLVRFCLMQRWKKWISMLRLVLLDVLIYTPIFSVDGLAGSEANCFLKRIACRLSSRWDWSYAEVLSWIRARLAFAIVRA